MDEITTTTETVSCKNKVMDRIECEGICPKSRLFFLGRECVMWLLWGASVILGALAVAITTFVLMHNQYALYEATHENLLTFIVGALPYLWLLVFVGMVGVAVYQLRHTKTGYRYPLWLIFGSSLALSLVGGLSLHLLGMGYTVDRALGHQMNMYMSQEKFETKLWQNPSEGRMVGRAFLSSDQPATHKMSFTDIEGRSWAIDVSDLSPQEVNLLTGDKNIRLIGVLNKENEPFHSCGVFPWLFDENASKEEFEAARKDFVTKMHRFEERVEGRFPELGDFDRDEEINESPCMHMTPLRRMH